MPALNYKEQFAPAVEIGLIDAENPKAKRQTIRAWRKRPIKKGDRLYMYTGMRMKKCRKLGEAVCKRARRIDISYEGIYLDGVRIAVREAEALARADGFDRLVLLYRFFKKTHGFPFSGQLIEW